MSIRAISRLTGYDQKPISKYLIDPDGVPVYGPWENREKTLPLKSISQIKQAVSSKEGAEEAYARKRPLGIALSNHAGMTELRVFEKSSRFQLRMDEFWA